eukprot:4055495-Pyramimonas_sp.AAC.1
MARGVAGQGRRIGPDERGGSGKGGLRDLPHAAGFGPAAGPIPRYLGAGRRRENQLRELILKSPLCYPPLFARPEPESWPLLPPPLQAS